MIGRNVSVELTTRHFNQVGKPSLDEFCENSFEIFMKISLAEAERMKMNYEAQPEPLGYELA